MADPLLTSLCAICHVSTPKYKCPRCGFQTCSLACTKKHKSWSECSGERDTTKYVPRARLRTAAGIDHDYNFLHGMELSMERAEKVLVGERALVREDELRPTTMQEVRWKRTGGPGSKPRKVVVTRVLREAKGRTFERFLAQRLRRLNVTILCAPTGMARQKENHTTLNRRTGRINWQVEWLTFVEGREDAVAEDEEGEGGELTGRGRKRRKTERVTNKVMDDMPLYRAYEALMEERAGLPKTSTTTSNLGAGIQDWSTSAWLTISSTSQDPHSGRWVQHQGAMVNEWPSRHESALESRHQFFLGKPYARSDQPAVVTQLNPGDCLREILRDTRVLEFPTIYVLRGQGGAAEGSSPPLPEGFVLGPKDKTVPQQQQQQRQKQQEAQGTKRKGGPEPEKSGSRAAKRNKNGGESDGEDDEDGSKGAVGFEAGEVVDEQEVGEEGEEDDSTSSSGTSEEEEEEDE